MIKGLVFVFLTFLSGVVTAQESNLEIKGTGHQLYLDHVVAPKESLYSLGRMYNVSPKELALFNHLNTTSSLRIGENLKIPLVKTNFTQAGGKTPATVLIPVYHTVVAGETLFRLGVNYNKVPLASLKKWNHMTSDAVKVGEPMIVGYLKVDKNLSALGKMENKPKEVTAVAPQEKPAEPSPSPAPVQHDSAAEKPAENKSVVTSQPAEPVKTQEPIATPVASKAGNDGSGGYFKNLYTQQSVKKTPISYSGNAGVFKSTSGWQDGKYYCFNNDVMPGTILKITNTANGKSVFAKVLDAIPDIKQNSGLSIIISNAAAGELVADQEKFNCTITYTK